MKKYSIKNTRILLIFAIVGLLFTFTFHIIELYKGENFIILEYPVSLGMNIMSGALFLWFDKNVWSKNEKVKL